MFLLQDNTTNAYNDAIRQRQGTTLNNFQEQISFMIFHTFDHLMLQKLHPLLSQLTQNSHPRDHDATASYT